MRYSERHTIRYHILVNADTRHCRSTGTYMQRGWFTWQSVSLHVRIYTVPNQRTSLPIYNYSTVPRWISLHMGELSLARRYLHRARHCRAVRQTRSVHVMQHTSIADISIIATAACSIGDCEGLCAAQTRKERPHLQLVVHRRRRRSGRQGTTSSITHCSVVTLRRQHSAMASVVPSSAVSAVRRRRVEIVRIRRILNRYWR